MSDVSSDPQLENDSAVGTTSQDSRIDAIDENGRKGLIASMSLFDSMLMLSFIFIVLATLRLFFVLRQYSEGFPFGSALPWSTAEYQWLMWF